MNTPVTVLIPTFNNEQSLPTLLTRLTNWAEEILVCDSGSTDSTQKIAASFGARCLERTYDNYAAQNNWAIPQASCEWILVVDSDELPEKELLDEITEFLKNPSDSIDIAWIPRKNLFWGSWMRRASGYPDLQARLFRRDAGRYEPRDVHPHIRAKGEIVQLRHHIIHDGFRSLSGWWLKSNQYFKHEVAYRTRSGLPWSAYRQFLFPVLMFLRLYILQGALFHGVPGFLRAFTKALYYFMVEAEVYERSFIERTGYQPFDNLRNY